MSRDVMFFRSWAPVASGESQPRRYFQYGSPWPVSSRALLVLRISEVAKCNERQDSVCLAFMFPSGFATLSRNGCELSSKDWIRPNSRCSLVALLLRQLFPGRRLLGVGREVNWRPREVCSKWLSPRILTLPRGFGGGLSSTHVFS